MKRKIIFITFLLLLSFFNSQKGYCQDYELNHYHRSSLYSILLKHPEQQFSKQIVETFLKIPLPEKYNNHNLKMAAINAPIL